MKNKYGLDLEKAVFVIDSPVTAFMVSILSEGCPVNIVLERKIELETDRASELLLNFVRSCINIGTMKKVQLPHRFYISGKDLGKIWNIRQQTRNLYDTYPDETIFVGASTSTFMRGLRCNPQNIIFLHHGLGDLTKKEDESKSFGTLKGKLRRIIIGKIMGLPHSIWCSFWPEKAFSLCKLKSTDERWLNLYDFESNTIKKKLDFIETFNDEKSNVLFFPVIEGHTKDGVASDVTSFDDFNYNFLSKYIDSDKDRVFVKYHPWLYRANDNTRSNLIQLLLHKGIEAYDIASMVPDSIGGVLLPTEVICRYAKIDKMISRDTSTMWYLSGNNQIEKIIDITQASDDYYKHMLHFIDELKIKSYSDDIKFYI